MQNQIAGCFEQTARIYDWIYCDRNVQVDMELLRRCHLLDVAAGPIQWLEVGCGTGLHALELARLGVQVTGLDVSEAMLSIARNRSGADRVQWVCEDIRGFDVEKKFDRASAFFAVLSYFTDECALRQALERIRRSLKPGGIFVADVWHGGAVQLEGVHTRRKAVTNNRFRIVRTSTPNLDPLRQLNRIHQEVVVHSLAGNRIIYGCEELHEIQYFYPEQVRQLWQQSGFSEIQIFSYPNFDLRLGPRDWDLGVLAVVA